MNRGPAAHLKRPGLLFSMPNVNQPSFRKRRDGRYVTKWAGVERFLGRERDAAWAKYLEELDAWNAWRRAKEAARRPPPQQIDVMTLAEDFVAAKEAEAGDAAGRYYRKHLKRFVDPENAYGAWPAEQVKAAHLLDLKLDMLDAGFARKTVNHDLTAVKAMLQHGMDRELIPPVNLSRVRKLPLGPVESKAVSLEAVTLVVYAAPEQLRPWLAVNYLAGCRPSEMPRLVHGEGEWVEEGIFRLDRGKMDARAAMKRHIVLTDRALAWLEQCRPLWKNLLSYSAACRYALGPISEHLWRRRYPAQEFPPIRMKEHCGPGGPGRLRHSCKTHLRAAGVSERDAELILGHYPPRTALVYGGVPWQHLRACADRISV